MNYNSIQTSELIEMANHGARRLTEMLREGTKSKAQANLEFREQILPIMKEVARRKATERKAA